MARTGAPDPATLESGVGGAALALDPAGDALEHQRTSAPPPLLLQARLSALPLRRQCLDGARVGLDDAQVSSPALPLALGDLHRSLVVGARIELRPRGGAGGTPSARLTPEERRRLLDVAVGAGFTVEDGALDERTSGEAHCQATRARTLADTVGPGMRLLVCGLNPSLLSADVGVGFARPGNRFWGAAVAVGAASRVRDPLHALHHHGTGMTDVVKRATVAAAELDPAEYRGGIARVERLCAWLRPQVVCFVGLTGWRAAVDRRAVAGPQPDGFGGVAAYVMPSTSGLNAHTKPADHVEHLRAALALAGRS